MHDLHCTISKWGQSEKTIAAWLHSISTKRIHALGRPPLLTLHHPPTLEYSARPTKNSCSSKIFTHFNYLPLDLIRNIGMCNVGLVHYKKKQSWKDSHNAIPFFVHPSPINLNTPPLNTTYIMTSSDMCGLIDALALTYPTIPKNGLKKWSNMSQSNVTWQFETSQCHTCISYFQCLYTVFVTK